jgi:hypothetical protein
LERVAVVPATFEPSKDGEFTLLVFSSNEILLEQLEGREPVSAVC